jgi:hypothetical protein
MALGCSPHEFVHCIAVGPDGAVAVRGAQGVARWAADGTLSWTRPAANDANYALAIDALGVVYTTVIAASGSDGLDLVQLAADGTPLPGLADFCNQYHAMLWLSGGAAACTSSGHSRVYGIGSIHVDDPDYVPTGMAGTGIGHAGWAFYEDDGLLPWQLTWRMRRHDAASQLIWQKTGGTIDLLDEAIGTTPLDLAGSATGRLALVGRWDGFDPDPRSGFVASFAP